MVAGGGGLSGSDLNKQVQEGEGSWGGKSNSRGIGDIPVSRQTALWWDLVCQDF